MPNLKLLLLNIQENTFHNSLGVNECLNTSSRSFDIQYVLFDS